MSIITLEDLKYCIGRYMKNDRENGKDMLEKYKNNATTTCIEVTTLSSSISVQPSSILVQPSINIDSIFISYHP